MELSSLYDLIKNIEYGTNLHIGVVFLNNSRNAMCALPHEHTIHSRPICEQFKKDPRQFEKCLKCRNYAIRRAVRDKEAFAALCINGVYEYTRPVFFGGKGVCVIFIGNILTDEGLIRLSDKLTDVASLFDTMERNADYARCDEIGRLLEGYVLALLEKYPEEKCSSNPIIENVKEYVRANLEYDLSLTDVASLYFYNEVYLGRLFKEECGKSFKEYVNNERIKHSKRLLSEGKTVIEAANKSGYNNVSYFERVFKRLTGVTPGEYKNEVMNV